MVQYIFQTRLLFLLFCAMGLSIPVLVVMVSLAFPASPLWRHLSETVLSSYIFNSLILMGVTGAGVAFGGVLSAWLVCMCRFPGQRFFEWALVLPLAMPAYVIAYAYTDFLDVSGPVQVLLRELTGWQVREYWFPRIRSVEGAATLFIFVLYPYVYLLARSAFLEQSVAVLEASRILGKTPTQTFWHVALPLARPAVVAGTALALMEVLADYGTVSYFSVPTFTTGIYRAWFGMGDRMLATQLASYLLLFVFALILVERYGRQRARFHATSTKMQDLPGFTLSGWQQLGAWLLCFIPVFVGFLAPLVILGSMALDLDALPGTWDRYLQYAVNSVILAGFAAFLTVLIAVFMVYNARLARSMISTAAVRVAALGYAVPGSVIAIGVLIPLAWLDQGIAVVSMSLFGIHPGLLLTGTIIALLYAYCVRFSSVSIGALESGYSKISPSLDEAARLLGRPLTSIFKDVHKPLLSSSILSAALIVFVDVMKELPATTLMRPFNFDTLAVKAHHFAADERLAEAAVASIIIALVGLLPVIVLTRSMIRTRRHNSMMTAKNQARAA